MEYLSFTWALLDSRIRTLHVGTRVKMRMCAVVDGLPSGERAGFKEGHVVSE